MARTVIHTEDVQKRFRLGVIGRDALWEEAGALLGKWRGGLRGRDLPPEGDNQRAGDWFWSLRGVSFSMEQGEILAILGRNGAGKSTLLKLLSRISLPTHGTIRMRGKVSSLLEVGTGFHHELTGRENIFLNGAILGMRRAEIRSKLDEIIAFSGIEHHLDTPIKRYSSGMRVRLGFSVAAHLDSEILIVDEVLAVGDAEFQRKCLGSMREVAQGGRTVLFVSHNMVAVQSLCTRALWLERGLVRQDGPVDAVARDYLLANRANSAQREWAPAEAPGEQDLKVAAVRVLSDHPEGLFTITAPLRIEVEVDYSGDDGGEDVNLRVQFRTDNDVLAFVTDMNESIGPGLLNRGRNKLSFTVPPHLLNDETYRLNLIFLRKGQFRFRVDDAVDFELAEGARTGPLFVKWPGAVRPTLRWTR